MIKIIHLSEMFLSRLTVLYTTEVFIQPSKNSESGFRGGKDA